LAGLICLSARIFALELAIEGGFEMKVNRACNRINHPATCLLGSEWYGYTKSY